MKSNEDKQHGTVDSVALLLRFGPAIVALIVAIVTGRRGRFGDPITFWILLPFILVVVLWPWRKKKIELFKRFILAIPFSAIFPIILWLVGFEITACFHVGVFIILALLIKANNWKLHFLITVITAAVSTLILVYMRQIAHSEDKNIYVTFFISGLGFFLFIFYLLYLSTLDSQKTKKWHYILSRSFKFSALVFTMITMLIISFMLCKHYNLGLAVLMIISALITLSFLGFYYRFKTGLSDIFDGNKKSKKADNIRKCILCGRPISDLEESHFIKENVVCEECYSKIEVEKSNIA